MLLFIQVVIYPSVLQQMIEQHSVFKALRTSKYYFYFTVLQLVLTSILFITLIVFSQAAYRVQLEVVIMILLLFDIVLKKLTDKQFFRKWRNIIDMTILTMLVIYLILQLFFREEINLIEQVGTLILIIRYGLQLYRIFSLIWQSRQVNLLHKLEDIRFEDIQISDELNFNRLQDKEPKAL